ncbi:copper resistance D family protein [Pseudalkalibacillus caeni]|uniref:Copper resistance protein CopD n=1 Tax=Exobacillus caeni TaxID=2574798 RepID=A0A5R9F3P2_9BACL|nr:CopD family protein [Pseudalkalibacillus caeni]TLS37010.1 copper resistance protein CopD [Pseudalkalibacillus caeni]
MMNAISITEGLLYVCFAILIGSFLLYSVPSHLRPAIYVPKKVLLIVTVLAGLLSFGPFVNVVVWLNQDMRIGLWETVYSVLSSFEVGTSLSLTLLFIVLLYLLVLLNDVTRQQFFARMALFFSILIIFAGGWASHAASLSQFPGFLSDSVHFFFVALWAGPILILGWFRNNHENWKPFLKWFTPFSIGSLSLITASGLVMMKFIVPDYTNSWVLTYGQALLIKHLLLVPLVVFAFINGFLIKRHLSQGTNPGKWLKAESIFILAIFTVTAFLSQRTPPHSFTRGLTEPSPLFLSLYSGAFSPDITIHPALNSLSYTLFALSVVFIGLTIFSSMKKTPVIISILFGFIVVLTGYLGIMASI